MDTLTETLALVVRREVEDYAGPAIRSKSYFLADDVQQVYAVLDVPDGHRLYAAGIALMARVVGDMVIIEADMHDRPLVGELVRLGIPREKIFLTYAGEQPPQLADAAQSSD